VNKPRPQPRPLAVFTGTLLAESFRKQGFASADIVARWPEIVGAEIATHAEPLKIQWPRTADPQQQEPGTLVLRVEGPAAIEIQHLAPVILERVNRFFGWQAVADLRLRQAPLARRKPRPVTAPDPARTAQIAASMPEIDDEGLKDALARLGASIKRT
jgi:hypothetical protein